MKKLALPLALLASLAALGSLSCQSRIPNRDPLGEPFDPSNKR